MTYSKPNIKYTDMAIYIDNNVYRDDLTEQDENLIFQYMYHIAYMIACKQKWFKNLKQCDDYAIFTATKVFLRYKNKKQYEFDEHGNPKMTKLKSCLNFMKSIAYHSKVDFEQLTYCQSNVQLDDLNEFSTKYNFITKLTDTCDELSICNFRHGLSFLENSCRLFLSKLPIKINSAEHINIYISCLLTFLNQIVLSNNDKAQIKNMYNHRNFSIDQFYLKCKSQNEVILFHLDNNYEDYIKVLTNEFKHFLAKDLQSLLHTELSSNSNVNLLLQKEFQFESID